MTKQPNPYKVQTPSSDLISLVIEARENLQKALELVSDLDLPADQKAEFLSGILQALQALKI